ncbi:MAG: SMP-30/gluconolactonase/LRE family protein [Methyloligellaceae bacterium]
MTDYSPVLLCNSFCLLGESPVWDSSSETLFWTDVVGKKVWQWSQKQGASSGNVSQSVGGLARASNGKLVVASERGVGFYTPGMTEINMIESDLSPAGTLMNDCKCDRQGRLIAGSKILQGKKRNACRFVIDKGTVKNTKRGYLIWNGPAFSPEGDRVYFADSPTRRIFHASYNIKKGHFGWARTFTKLSDDEGYPDGMTIDAEGRLWSARWGGWCVVRYDASGKVDLKIQLPVPNPTSLTFGGPDYRDLYITSAREGLSEQELGDAPLSGAVFVIRTENQGLEEVTYSV